jgi:hypothetical protein
MIIDQFGDARAVGAPALVFAWHCTVSLSAAVPAASGAAAIKHCVDQAQDRV